MSEQILTILKRRLDDSLYTKVDPKTRRNVLKEELQFYVLNFIYHHPDYSKWTMYGGSALRIIHGLDRMSVDLDFEVSDVVTGRFLDKLKKEIESHFINTYGAGAYFPTVKVVTHRGLLLRFHVGEELSFGHPSKQVHVRIDLNHFVAPKVVTERRPINHDQLSFVIVTYNMAGLFASKIAAIFLRETRGIDKDIYSYKGRDIYDLLWYMGKKITPDFDYVNAKLKKRGKEVSDIKALFDKLTIDILNYEKMDDCLKADLPHLFENPHQFENWLKNWRKSYVRLLDDYKIRTIATLEKVIVSEDFKTDNFSFTYLYDTTDGTIVRVVYVVAWEWIKYQKLLGLKIDEDVIKLTAPDVGVELNDQLKQFITLFYQKTENYFKKINRIMLGDAIITKVIRTTADNLNPKEQILLNRSALLSCELDDLLK